MVFSEDNAQQAVCSGGHAGGVEEVGGCNSHLSRRRSREDEAALTSCCGRRDGHATTTGLGTLASAFLSCVRFVFRLYVEACMHHVFRPLYIGILCFAECSREPTKGACEESGPESSRGQYTSSSSAFFFLLWGGRGTDCCVCVCACVREENSFSEIDVGTGET